MKNKIILFVVIFLVPFVVKANSISIVCDKDVVKDTSLNCTLKGNSDILVTAVSAKVRIGSNITFSSFTPSSSWLGDGEEGNIDLYTADDITGTFTIGDLVFNVDPIYEGGNSTITIDSVFFYDDNGKEFSVNPIAKSVRLASSINNLSSLSLSTGNLNPNFSDDITSYSTTIDASSVEIFAKAESNYATISGNVGKVNLNYGNNTFRIVVTSESGTTKTYTINIVRPNNNVDTNDNNQSNNITVQKSNNNYLKNINLSEGSINFDKNTTEYQIKVNYNITNIDVIAIPEDDKSKVEITGNNNLMVGNNKIEIKVTAEDNSSRIYTINVERKEEDYSLSNNNYISSIKIKDYEFNFDKYKENYTLKIWREKELDIEVLLEDSKSSYNIEGNNDLENGSVIKILVTAEDGGNKTYRISIESNDKVIRAVFIMIIIILLIINIVRIFLKYRREKNEAIFK